MQEMRSIYFYLSIYQYLYLDVHIHLCFYGLLYKFSSLRTLPGLRSTYLLLQQGARHDTDQVYYSR